MAIPKKEDLLAGWTSNADALLTASPATYGTTAAVATAYHLVSQAYVDAFLAVENAGAQRTSSMIAARDQAKVALLAYARPLYTTVQANTSVTYQAKVDLGVKVKSPPSPIPAPAVVPIIQVVSVFGRTVRLRIINPLTGRRNKPAGCVGIAHYSFAGSLPPSGDQQYHPEGNVTKNEIIVTFPDSVAFLSSVYFTGYYYTARGLSGVSCVPVQTFLGGAGANPLGDQPVAAS